VAFGPKQRSIGESAKTQETSNYKNTVGSLKRLVGRTLNDPEIQGIEKKFMNATLVDCGGTVGVEVCIIFFVMSTFWFTDLPSIG
jgi:heat shock protein 4